MEISVLKVDIENRCNFSCSYCRNSDIIHNGVRFVSTKTLRQVINEIGPKNLKFIVYMGGEPFFENTVFSYLDEFDIPASINTNGVLLENSDVVDLANFYYDLGRIYLLRISYDGPIGQEKHRSRGSAKQLEKIIKCLGYKARFPYAVHTVATSENLADLALIYDTVDSSGAFQWSITYAYGKGRAKANQLSIPSPKDFAIAVLAIINRYLNERPDFRLQIDNFFSSELIKPIHGGPLRLHTNTSHPCCGGVSQSVYIDYYGNVFFCPKLNIKFGNLNNNTLTEILSGTAYGDFMKLKVSDVSECNRCKYLSLCGGGCPGNVLIDQGRLSGIDKTSCDLMQQFSTLVKPLLDKNGINLYTT